MAARSSTTTIPRPIVYPTRDGRPLGETEDHIQALMETHQSLRVWFAAHPQTYVAGNMLVFYVPGDKRRHLSPDIFVVHGIAKHRRDHYLAWEEGKGPDCVIELTSPSTRREDLTKKFAIYRDILLVREYFLFDPKSQYLKPRLQGYRLVEGRYDPIEPIAGRMPSATLGLHLEGDGPDLRLFNAATGLWLPNRDETEAARQEAEAARQEAEAARQEAEAARQEAEAARQEAETALRQADYSRHQAEDAQQQADAARHQAEAQNDQLRRELDELRRRLPS